MTFHSFSLYSLNVPLALHLPTSKYYISSREIVI